MEERREGDKAILAKLNGFEELVKSEFGHINTHLATLNSKVADNCKWISENKTDIKDVIKDRKNLISNMFKLAFKILLLTVGVVFGVNFIR